MRLDEYLDTKQEAQMERPQVYEDLEGTRRELEKATEKLGEACRRLGEAEATLTAARAAMQAAGQATPPVSSRILHAANSCAAHLVRCMHAGGCE